MIFPSAYDKAKLRENQLQWTFAIDLALNIDNGTNDRDKYQS